MRVATAVCLAAAALAGCGAESDRDRVESYIEAANRVTREAGPRLSAANAAFRRFAAGELKGRRAGRELRSGELAIEQARQDLAQLRPPAAARPLHALLLRHYELNVLMAAETRQMAGYAPRAGQALQRLRGVQRRLRRGLRASAPPRVQVRALRRYASEIGAIVDRLRSLEAPAVLVADRDTQLRRLGRARSLARRLAAAIERMDADAVTRLLHRFRDSSDPRPELGGLSEGQIRAYRQRLAVIDRAAAAVRSETARLNRDLEP